ncbi:MAG: glycosyl hydrolase 53 family protein [Clostridiaceae bacterium]
MFDLGMDFSTLEETESLGGVFRQDGKAGNLVEILAENGVNAARLRLWVDPYSFSGAPYGGGTCDFALVKRLARRAKDAGMRFLLDLHYSDFWCDPGRQLMPKAWANLGLEALEQRVYDDTKETLLALRAAGLEPDIVQVGNEITNGMLWPLGRLSDPVPGERRTGYESLSRFVNAGCRAVREVSRAKVMLHLERSGDNAVWREWFDELLSRGADFDVIGASYYPYWHGNFEALRTNLNDMIARYQKDVMVVETAYAFTSVHFDPTQAGANLVINDSLKCYDGSDAPYPLSIEGQRLFVNELLSLVASLDGGHGTGVYYWEPAWLPLKGSTWATEAAREYMCEQQKPGGNEWANQCIFDYEGNATPALKEFASFARAHKL